MSEALRPFALSSLRRGAAIALMLQVVGLGLSYVLNILLARWLGTSEYGTYAYVMVWAGILATLAGFGVPEAALRFTAQYRATAEWALLRGFMHRQPWLILGSSVVVASLAGAALVGLSGLDRIGVAYGPAQVGRPLLVLAGVASVAAAGSSAPERHRVGDGAGLGSRGSGLPVCPACENRLLPRSRVMVHATGVRGGCAWRYRSV